MYEYESYTTQAAFGSSFFICNYYYYYFLCTRDDVLSIEFITKYYYHLFIYLLYLTTSYIILLCKYIYVMINRTYTSHILYDTSYY